MLILCNTVLPAAPARAQGLSAPEPVPAMNAYRTIESWVRAWSVPEVPADVDPEGTHAAAVTLRLDGAVIGRGEAFADERNGAVYAATKKAYEAADNDLPISYGPERPREAIELAKRITLHLELAGSPIPMIGERYETVALGVRPHLEAAGMRAGAREAMVFPGEQRLRGIEPGRTLRVAAGKLDLPPQALGELRERFSATPLKYPVVEIAQPAAASPAVFLHRGGRVVSRDEIDTDTLQETADLIARHMQRRMWPGEERYGLRGTYDPVNGSWDPIAAPPRDQGIAAYVLARSALSSSWLRSSESADRLALAKEIIEQLAAVEDGEIDPRNEPLAAAAWIIGAAESGVLASQQRADLRGFGDACALAVREAPTAEAWWRSRGGSGGRAILALALAELSRSPIAQADDLERSRQLVRNIFAETQAGELVSAMPWLGLAELATIDEDERIPSLIALLRMREAMWEFQVTIADAGFEDRDLAGGIVFTRSRSPLPSWQGLRPLAFVAVMLRDERLTEPTAYATELSKLAGALRFVVQLTVRDAELHLAAEPSRARGGVRLALWDPRLALDAQSLALLTLVETLDSAESRGRPRPAPVPTRIDQGGSPARTPREGVPR